ncbi:MAG: hypothetical protein HOE53_02275, partial [Candidatus Magasanikbacteria bacterium]|nr:hypothetical protein [Candidatus Magasanikbacteria bacterium]
MNPIRWIVLGLFGVLILTGALCPPAAWADSAYALKIYNEGVAAFKQAKAERDSGQKISAHQHFLKARRLFADASAQDPTVGGNTSTLIYNMARASEEAAVISGGREVNQAIADMRAFLRVKPNDKDGLKRLVRLQSIASRQAHVDFKGHPSDARIFVNKIEAHGALMLNPGEYDVQYKLGNAPVQARGTNPKLVVKAKAPVTYRWPGVKAKTRAKGGSAHGQTDVDNPGLSRKTWGWITVGGAAAFAGGGLVLYTLSANNADEWNNNGDASARDASENLYY